MILCKGKTGEKGTKSLSFTSHTSNKMPACPDNIDRQGEREGSTTERKGGVVATAAGQLLLAAGPTPCPEHFVARRLGQKR